MVRKNYLRTTEFSRHYRQNLLTEKEEEDVRVGALVRQEVLMVTEAARKAKFCEREDEALSGVVMTEEVAARVVGITSQPVNYQVQFIDRCVPPMLQDISLH